MIALAAQFDQDVATNPHAGRIRCGFEVEFASKVSRQEVSWAMREFTRGASIRVSRTYGASHKSNYTHWGVENDTSINTDREYKVATEIVSPIMDLDTMLDKLEATFQLVGRLGRTDNSTGLHVTFSLSDVRLDDAKFDPLKLLLLLGEHYWATVFGRENASFASSLLNQVKANAIRYVHATKKAVTYADCVEAVKLFNTVGFTNVESPDGVPDSFAHYIRRAINAKDRRQSINIQALAKPGAQSRVEFRLMGGSGYEYKFDKVSTLVRRFAYALWASCSTESDKYNDVYARKLYRLLRDTAGAQVNTEEVEYSKIRLVPSEDEPSSFSASSYKIEHLFKYKGQKLKEKQNRANYLKDDLGNIEFDKNGKITALVPFGHEEEARLVLDAFAQGKLTSPTGEKLDIADYAYAVCGLKSEQYNYIAALTLWVGGDERENQPPSSFVPRLNELEPNLVRKYGKAGAAVFARIISSSVTIEFIGWLQGSSNRMQASCPAKNAAKSNDFSEITKELEIYNSYVKRYSKFFAEGVNLDIGCLSYSAKDWYSRMVADGKPNEDFIPRIVRNNSLHSSATRPENLEKLLVYVLQRAAGRNDLATITILCLMQTFGSHNLGDPTAIHDWTFLDPKWVKEVPLNVNANLAISLVDSMYSAAKNSRGFVTQYMTKASKEAVKAVVNRFILTNSVQFSTVNKSDDDWYAKTGIPAVDKAAKAAFDTLVKVNAKKPLDYLLAGYEIAKRAKLFVFLSRATKPELDQYLFEGAECAPHMASFARNLCAVINTSATLPDNKAITDVLLTDEVKHAMYVQLSAYNGTNTLPRDFFGINHIEYLKSLLVTKYNDGYDYIPFLRNMAKSGVPADYLLYDPAVVAFIYAQSTKPHATDVDSFLRAVGVITQTPTDNRVVTPVASPVLYAILKKDKRLAVMMPHLADALDHTYRPARARRN